MKTAILFPLGLTAVFGRVTATRLAPEVSQGHFRCAKAGDETGSRAFPQRHAIAGHR